MNRQDRHIISVIVVNESSVLARISGLFAGRGYNIESLTVAPIPNKEGLSRLTIETYGDCKTVTQIEKQLNKLIPVMKVIERDDFVEKEMALVKIPIEESLSDVDALARAYNGKIVNVGDGAIICMVADEPQRVAYFLNAVKRFNPIEVIRSGVVALER
jgi:acetolactate synthase-1/3 small subunit